MSEVRRRLLRSPAGRHLALAAGLGLAFALASCYPGGVTDVAQLDAVVTYHIKDAEFGALKNFALPDTVIEVVFDSTTYIPVSHDYDDEILARVRSNFEGRGYVYEPDPASNRPQSVVLVGVTASRINYYYYDWWYYWGWWPGWGYYPGYGPGWGYYPPPVIGEGSFDQGTLMVYMLDVRDPDADLKEQPLVWAAALRGILSGSTPSSITARIDKNIDQAFAQSPYLKAN